MPALSLDEWRSAWMCFTAATQINVAVRVWWRWLNQCGGSCRQSYQTDYGRLQSMEMRAQGPVDFMINGDVRWAAGFCANLLWSQVSLPSLRSLRDTLLYNGTYRTRRGRKGRADGRLVQPSYHSWLALQPFMAGSILSLRALPSGRFPATSFHAGRKSGLIGPEIVI
jgi:hypothetical protein